MPARFSQFVWGQEQWRQADLDWLPTYPDQVRIGYRRHSPAREGYFTIAIFVPATTDTFSSIFGSDYPDIVPTYKHRIYLHPTSFVVSPEAMTAPQLVLNWQPEYPDFLRHNRRNAYSTPFDTDFLHDVRPEPTAAEMAGIFGTECPDIVPTYKRRVYLAPSYAAPLRAPGTLWTEPAITVTTTTWTEPATTPTIEGAALQ